MAAPQDDTADFRVLSTLLSLVNGERKKHNLPEVALSTQLCQAAQAHARDMIARSYFADKSPEGIDLAHRAQTAGYRGKTAANLAMGPEDPREAMASFLSDAQNRATLVNPAHQHLGVGQVEDAWVVLFGAHFDKPQTAPSETDQGIVEAFLEEVNRERGRVGRFPLRISEQLSKAAHVHALDMFQKNYLSARAPDGTTLAERVKRAGFEGRVGGCVLSGATTVAQALSIWLKDDGNRQNIHNGEFRHLGAAQVNQRWVLILGTPPLAANASPELAGAVLDLVNRKRQKAQTPARPLGLSEYLNGAAQEHARHMVEKDYVGAKGPDGQGLTQCIDRAGFRGNLAASFAKGPVTAEAVVDGWMQVEADRNHLLAPAFTEMGLGVVESRWVIVVGTPKEEAAGRTPEFTSALLDAVNIERARALVSPLSPNDRLMEAAQAHSEDMAKRDFASSQNPEGEGPDKRVRKARYPFRNLAELIAVDQPAPRKVVEAWMQSPGHRSHLLNKDFVHIGIGVAGSRWTILLAKPQG